MVGLDALIETRFRNAVLSWLLVAVLAVSVAVDLLNDEVLWASFTAVVIAVALVPTVVASDATVTVSWEILLVSAVPALARLADVFVDPLGYLSVAALGLLVVAEIDQFTPARLPGWFAAAMVVMTTMSVASSWVIVRYFANLSFGTAFATSIDALMVELIVASGIGLGFGVLFELGLREARAT